MGLRSRSRRGTPAGEGARDDRGWTQPATAELLRLRGGEPGSGYRCRGDAGRRADQPWHASGCSSPSHDAPPQPTDAGVPRDAADWLATMLHAGRAHRRVRTSRDGCSPRGRPWASGHDQGGGTPAGGAHGMTDEWTQPARRELLRLRGGEAGWGYRAGATPGVEPTALACLGLLVSEPDAPPADGRRAPRDAADWLATIQRPDGSLGLSATQPTPGWTTPYALLLWKALATREPECRRAPDGCSGSRAGRPLARTTLTTSSGTTRRWSAGPGSPTPTPGSNRRRWPSWRWAGRAGRAPEGCRGPPADPRPRGRHRRLELRQQGHVRPSTPAPARPDRPGAADAGADAGRAPLAARRSGDPLPDRDVAGGARRLVARLGTARAPRLER